MEEHSIQLLPLTRPRNQTEITSNRVSVNFVVQCVLGPGVTKNLVFVNFLSRHLYWASGGVGLRNSLFAAHNISISHSVSEFISHATYRLLQGGGGGGAKQPIPCPQHEHVIRNTVLIG